MGVNKTNKPAAHSHFVRNHTPRQHAPYNTPRKHAPAGETERTYAVAHRSWRWCPKRTRQIFAGVSFSLYEQVVCVAVAMMNDGDPNRPLRTRVAYLETQLRHTQGKLEVFDGMGNVTMAVAARRKARHILSEYVAAQRALRFAVASAAGSAPLQSATGQEASDSFEAWMRQVPPTRLHALHHHPHQNTRTAATQTPPPPPPKVAHPSSTRRSEFTGAMTGTETTAAGSDMTDRGAAAHANLAVQTEAAAPHTAAAAANGRTIEIHTDQSRTPTIEKS